ncbi:interleukin-12 receptor subunit beta-2 [Hoplias malabaricus]|uniref:interleukin-12 receptor subunit beta-2 n=1 Tax=Hoplias malabaricus TaxID=27720 RepID=UPI0034632FDA
MVDLDVLLEQVDPMPLKCSVWSNFIFLLLVLVTETPEASSAADGKKCSLLSAKEVHMGLSFHIYCVSRNDCQKKTVFQDMVQLDHKHLNSTTVSIYIKNLTKPTTFICKCDSDPEPCGTDIIPGYPPEIPQNLTCVQEGELGNVNCTWKTRLKPFIQTTSHLRVQGEPPVDYTSIILHDGKLSAVFPIPASQTNFTVQVKASNSLGSESSANHSFTLNDIVKPISPNIAKVECSSITCQLHPDNTQDIQLVEIQYKADWGSWNTLSFDHTHSSRSWKITSLKPYSLYKFQVRWKFSPTRGVWSEWSKVEAMTDEEVPAAMVDAWYVEDTKYTVNKHIQLFWKELSKSEARGKILGYNVSVLDQEGVFVNHTIRSLSVPCSYCVVNIFAVNSKGKSPVRSIRVQPIDSYPLHLTVENVNNSSIAISWSRPASAPTLKEYLVEWYPAGRKDQLQWIRVQPHINTSSITGLKPTVCYDIAVVYLQSDETKKNYLNSIATWQSAPQQGPDCFATVKNDNVEIKWYEVHPDKRGGCLIKYSIYLQVVGGKISNYIVDPSKTEYTITGLALGHRYKVWISAWTKVGEGPKGNVYSFITKSGGPSDEKPLVLVVSIGCIVFVTCLILLIICQFPSVHRRLSHCCHCLKPSIVPDPANSKWAKECATEKGEMKLQLYLSDSSLSEEEPDTVDVHELPHEKLFQRETSPIDDRSHLVSNLSISDQDQSVLSSAYQPKSSSSYIKSLSQESNSSDGTQASRNTDITVDYISTHGVLSEEEEDEEEDMDVLGFFPCPISPFLDPLMSTGGKLTLDIVKIDCSDLNLCVQ